MAQFSMAYVSIITNEHILLKITLFTEISSLFGIFCKVCEVSNDNQGELSIAKGQYWTRPYLVTSRMI